jgi:hypothetical protein
MTHGAPGPDAKRAGPGNRNAPGPAILTSGVGLAPLTPAWGARHQRPYHRRRPPSAPPMKNPISHRRTAKIRMYQRTCAANPRPPKMASIKTSASRATTFTPPLPLPKNTGHASARRAGLLPESVACQTHRQRGDGTRWTTTGERVEGHSPQVPRTVFSRLTRVGKEKRKNDHGRSDG